MEARVAKAKSTDEQKALRCASRVRLGIKIDDENASQTYAQIKAADAEILCRLGDQTVVSVPMDSVEAISRIEGVLRMDVGHKHKWMTDIVRKESGVTLIDGSQSSSTVPLTGKGVTVCVVDVGFDFQHPAFKDSEGRSRIKAVYMPYDKNGRPFVVDDPIVSTYQLPGSVYDTPELIASLTTDMTEESHGTHTAGIAAGSLSPMGFGGMATEADLVLIPIPEYDDEGNEIDENVFQMAFTFAACYAQIHNVPMVVSLSGNGHDGPHDGTGTMPEAIRELSEHAIPVLSVGNEGDIPLHIYKQFTETEPSVKAMLPSEGLMGKGSIESGVVGYTRHGGDLSVQLSLYNRLTKKTLWQSSVFTATPGMEMAIADFADDEELTSRFEGDLMVTYGSVNGKQNFAVYVVGEVLTKAYFTITVTGPEGTEVDLWEQTVGFEEYGADGFSRGNTDLSAGDWTSIPEVVSVGAYCTNRTERTYSSSTTYALTEGSILDFSSYGTMPNGVTQPTVSAPGVFVVSSWNHYNIDDDEKLLDNMLWQGYPYSAETGTSMSCPVVSGIVALWLQAKPDLTVEDIQRILKESARNDEYTMANSLRAGFGKVDASRGLEYILSSDIHEINDTTSTTEQVLYDLQGRRVSSPSLSKGIYIKAGRKYILR